MAPQLLSKYGIGENQDDMESQRERGGSRQKGGRLSWYEMEIDRGNWKGVIVGAAGRRRSASRDGFQQRGRKDQLKSLVCESDYPSSPTA